MRDRSRSAAAVLVTGCPRSGTKYIAFLLRELGLDVRHEAMGRDGTASWCMAVDADATPWGPPRRAHAFAASLHQVRNPALVIPSLSTLQPASWQFVFAHTPCRPADPPLVRSAKLWYHWNRHAERTTQWRYRVEHLPAAFDEFCSRVGVAADRRALRRVQPNVNTRAFAGVGRAVGWLCGKLAVEPPAVVRNRCTDRSVYASSGAAAFGWDALRALDPPTHDRVLGLALEYGYTPADLGLVPAPIPVGDDRTYASQPSAATAAVAVAARTLAGVSAAV